MYFKFGDYQHDAGTVDVSNITMQRMYSRRNRLLFMKKTLQLVIHVCESGGQDDIKSKIEEIKLAYGADHQVDRASDQGRETACRTLGDSPEIRSEPLFPNRRRPRRYPLPSRLRRETLGRAQPSGRGLKLLRVGT